MQKYFSGWGVITYVDTKTYDARSPWPLTSAKAYILARLLYLEFSNWMLTHMSDTRTLTAGVLHKNWSWICAVEWFGLGSRLKTNKKHDTATQTHAQVTLLKNDHAHCFLDTKCGWCLMGETKRILHVRTTSTGRCAVRTPRFRPNLNIQPIRKINYGLESIGNRVGNHWHPFLIFFFEWPDVIFKMTPTKVQVPKANLF